MAFLAIVLQGLATPGATLVVTTTSDSGAGSLRQAILDANATNGVDTINFQIGTGAHTITPGSALPSITDAVIIDGTTQPGFVLAPLIEINGASAGSSSVGLRLLTTNCTIRGLVINRFAGQGLLLQGNSGHTIKGNYIGTDTSGAIARPNGMEGIWVNGSSSNMIGGTNAADRNLISGNGGAGTSPGIYLLNSSGNLIQGNFIGTGIGGTSALANANNGITLSSSSGNQVGGTAAAQRNVISGNGGSGVYLLNSGATGNLIQGNYIGTDVTGTVALANSGDGVTIDSASANTIGGTALGAGNVISGNSQGGIALKGSNPANNLIQGNYIGTTASGLAALGNTFAGVTLTAASSNSIGGTVAGARNVISGNKKDGILVSTNSLGNLIAGNYIGLNGTGTSPVPNSFNGITIASASLNTVGGSAGTARNVISGNTSHGVHILSGATGNSLQGNYIGTDSSGSLAKGNSLKGVRIESPGNSVGGSSSAVRNLISGNTDDGIGLVGSAATGNTIQGNFVGVNAAGTSALPNGVSGIGLSVGASGNLIGGTAAGAGNLCSANNNAGIYLIDAGTSGNQIQGNFIGTDVNGTSPLPNVFEGIYMERASSNTIGGASSGSGNLISGNNWTGIWVTNASWNTFQHNLFGTKIDGVSALPNGRAGIDCDIGAHNNTIGGPAGAGNVIAFAPSPYAGVRIRDGATNTAVLGNSIFSNGSLGIYLGPYAGPTGVVANDPCDTDTGANMLQNYPILSQAVSGSGTGVRGTLNSKASTLFLLQFFANPGCNISGYGEGRIYLGDKSVVTAANCSTNFVADFPLQIPVGYVVTATATDPSGNTSEFSPCLTVTPVPPVTIARPINNQISLSWTNTGVTFALKQTGSLSPPIQWSTVTSNQVNTPGMTSVALPLVSTNRFYRLSFE